MSGIGPFLVIVFFAVILGTCANNDPLAPYRANVKKRKRRNKRRKNR